MKSNTRRQVILLILLLVFLPAAASGGAAERPELAPGGRKIVRQGISIELDLEPLTAAPGRAGELREGDTVAFRFQITDTNTDTPLSGVYPAAWMDRRPEGEATDDAICQDKVEAFVGGSLLSQPELDLNVYYVLALNDDASISVVDPLFGFGTTKLLDMIFLESPGEDWALTADQTTLYVSMPEVDKVAVASTSTWEVLADIGVGPRPSRVVLQGDQHYLWVGYDAPRTMPYWVEPRSGEASGVTVVDTRLRRVMREIPTGRGHHEIAFSGDDRWAFVTNQDEGTLSILDVGKLEKTADVAVGREPVSLAYSELADSVYVVSRADGVVTVVDAGRHEVVSRVQAEPGLGQIKFAPGGRLALIVNSARDVVHVLDAASNRIVQTGDVEDGPDQVAFSDHLAYVRHRDSETVLMIPLDQIGQEGLPVPVIDFPGGQRPFGRGSRPSLGDSIVQAPGATAVLVANPADQAIYFYKEGMAAPMGNFQNYDRQPRAVLAIDRSLRERSPGSYETIAALRRPGRYDVAFFIDSPRTIHCFEVEVEPNPELEAQRARAKPVEVQPIYQDRVLEPGERIALKVGQKAALRFQLVDSLTKKPRAGLDDVSVLTFLAPGRHQRRQPARQVGSGGVYQVDFVPPRAGVYYAFVECASAGLRYNESGFVIVEATSEMEAGS